MTKLLRALVMGALLISTPAAAGACKPADEVLNFIKQVAPTSTVVLLTPAQTQAVIKWADDLFHSNMEGKIDVIYLLRDPQLGTGLAFGLDGEICGVDDVPGPAVPSLMRALEGDPA